MGGALRTSIALATYQGEQYVAEQLESYLEQTRLPDELVVSDNRSTDATVSLVEAFGKSAPFPIQIVANSCKRGITGNFENAVRNCRHELIFLSDQDDYWLP